MDAAEVARRSFDAIERGDIEAFLEHVHPRVEFNSLIADADARTFRGHGGVREWWRTVRGSLGGVHFEIQGFEQVNDDWALIKIRASGTVSEVEVEQIMWQAVRIQDEKVTRWAVHRTEEEARAAIGRPAPEEDLA